jgi:hypothetical protein
MSSTTTTISLTWRPIPQRYVRGILRGYDVAHHEMADYRRTKTVIRLNTTFTSLVIKNLKQNTNYGVRIAGLTKVRGFIRNGKISPTWNITTSPGKITHARLVFTLYVTSLPPCWGHWQ